MKKDIKQQKTTKISITEEYFNYHEKYIAKYGLNTVILLEVGSFYEMYSNPLNNKGPDLYKISEILNLVVTRKDKTIPLSDTNVLMSGLPNHAIAKFLKILIDNNFTVVIFNQQKTIDGVTRSLEGIYSPSTFIDNITTENKYLMTLYFEFNNALNSNKSNISIGMCAVDSSTNQVFWYEFHGSGILNENEAWEEAQRFYHFFRPVELIIYNINNSDNKNIININEKIDLLPNQITLNYNKINPSFTKINYQNTLLRKIYSYCSMDNDIINFLNLEKFPYAIIALVNTFDYIFQHNENLIKNLKIPQFFNEHKYMVLGNNAQYQLNIVDYYNWDKIDSKFHSLNSVINNCSTPMGKRTLKQRLCAPFTNKDKIEFYYNLTDKFLQFKLWENVRSYLKEISDLDKLFRKLSIKYIQPYELYSIYESLRNIVKIIEILSKSPIKSDLFLLLSKSDIKKFISSINDIENKFIIDKIKHCNLNDIKNSFYHNNIYTDLDQIENDIENGIGLIEKIAKKFESINSDISLNIKHNDRDGYYLQTTKIRGEKLNSELKKQQHNIKIENKEIKFTDLIFTFQTNTCKITYSGLSDHSDEIDDLYVQLQNKIKEYFYSDILNWYNNYNVLFKNIIYFIVELDLITNNAFTSSKFHYVKPIISSNTNSFINTTNLRHPIIERIIDYEYVPHNVILNDDNLGNMIYGVNSCGKCFASDTLLLMFNNTFKKACDIIQGDLLMGDDSTPRTVLGTTCGFGEMYEIITNNSTNNFIVNGPHILCLKNNNNKQISWINNCEYNVKWFFNGNEHNKVFTIEKYITKENTFNNAKLFYDTLVFDEIIEISVDDYLKKNNNWKSNYLLYKNEIFYEEQIIDIDAYIFGNNILNNNYTFIPDEYKFNSRINRLKLLAGFLDSINNYDSGFIIYLNNINLVNDIVFIAKSIGFSCNITENNNCYEIFFEAIYILYNEISLYLFYKRPYNKNFNPSLISFTVKSIGINKYYGFETDGNKRFLLESLIVTHNSSLMKAVGLGLIMAQCGFYVPAEKFEYGIFDSLYTRISGNDNLFRGHSSFIIEMNELRTILKKADSKSLIIGDEICRGTEYLSANAIVASSILKLVDLKAKFLFATHLHELIDIEKIKSLNLIKFFHLSVEKKGDELIFNRQLIEGTGEQIYGITIAQYILNDPLFINTAIELKNELLNKSGINTKLVNDKKSLYNKDIYMDSCSICGSSNKLESHHINWQKDFITTVNGNINKKKSHIIKDSKANLIVLCDKCHDNLHSGNFTISTLVKTSSGIKAI